MIEERDEEVDTSKWDATTRRLWRYGQVQEMLKFTLDALEASPEIADKRPGGPGWMRGYALSRGRAILRQIEIEEGA